MLREAIYIMEIIHSGDPQAAETFTVKGVLAASDEIKLEYTIIATFVKPKDRLGSLLMVDSGDGVNFVEFPRTFSRPELDAILKRNITYSHSHWMYDEGNAGLLQSHTYRLQIEDGPSAGWEVNEKIIL